MMRFLSFLLFLSCAGVTKRPVFGLPSGQDFSKLWFQNGCTLYKNSLIVKTFPGLHCAFLDDGSFISVTAENIKRFSPDKTLLWEIPGHFHHQVNLSPDGKRILTLSSEVVEFNKEKVRDDVIVVLDLDGKILSRQSVVPLLDTKAFRFLNWRDSLELKPLGATAERTHFNSIYEIPENAASEKLPWMKPGNIIANSSGMGFFVFDPAVKKILYAHNYREAFFNLTHDVQVTKDGGILIFNNSVRNPRNSFFSAIQIYDPITEKVTFDYRSSPEEFFYSPACGGVQDMGDHLFVSHIIMGGFLISKKDKKTVRSFPGYNGNNRDLRPIQQLKLIDAEKFLQNSR